MNRKHFLSLTGVSTLGLVFPASIFSTKVVTKNKISLAQWSMNKSFFSGNKDPYDFAQTEGRPLGLKFDLQGNLIVADAYEGLLSIDTTGEITILSTECDSLPFLLTDDLDISSDGIIYFSDASSVNNLANNGDDWGEPNGRLLAYNPQTNETSLLLDSLYKYHSIYFFKFLFFSSNI